MRLFMYIFTGNCSNSALSNKLTGNQVRNICTINLLHQIAHKH